MVLLLAEAATANSSNFPSEEANDINLKQDLTTPPHYFSLLDLTVNYIICHSFSDSEVGYFDSMIQFLSFGTGVLFRRAALTRTGSWAFLHLASGFFYNLLYQ